MGVRFNRLVFLVFAMVVAPATSAESIDWPTYGGAAGGGHYSTAKLITKTNVAGLTNVWTHRSGDFRGGVQSLTEAVSEEMQSNRPTSFIGTPIMVKGTLYYCTPFNRVFALDPATGEERWVFDPDVDMENEPLTNCRGVSSWIDPAPQGKPCEHRIILATLDSRLMAMDGKTGQACKDFGVNGSVDLTEGLNPHEDNEYGVTSAPAIIGDLIVTGAYVTDSIRSDIPSGVVRAYNVRSGHFAWGWNPVHPQQKPVNEHGEYTPGSTNVWSTISVDEERGLVIVPTGNSSPDYYGGDRTKQEDYYSSSVVALNALNGEVVWHYQTVHHDIWDYDVPAQPTLMDVTINGEPRALRPDYLVVNMHCTHLGCVPQMIPQVGPQPFDDDWQGGFYCPCHKSKFDLSGRVFRGVPAPTNLRIPPHSFLDDNTLMIGVSPAGAV